MNPDSATNIRRAAKIIHPRNWITYKPASTLTVKGSVENLGSKINVVNLEILPKYSNTPSRKPLSLTIGNTSKDKPTKNK
jgi:flagella basal body P-ring formation protein FlgA